MKFDHISTREYKDCFLVNIIFTLDVENAFNEVFVQKTKEYTKVKVMDSEEDYRNYHSLLDLSFEDRDENEGSPVKITSNYHKSPEEKVQYEDIPLLRYLDKFDKYVYREYVDKNPITLGAFKMLNQLKKDLMNEHEPHELYSYEYTLFKIIEALDLFWN
jgi:hypothetical protein